VLKSRLEHWKLNIRGRPSTYNGFEALSTLIKRAENQQLSTFPNESLFDIDEVLSVESPSGRAPIESLDLWTMILRDLEEEENNPMLPGPSSFHVWPSLLNSEKPFLGSHCSFLASIDLPATPLGMGRITMTPPSRYLGSVAYQGTESKTLPIYTSTSPSGYCSSPVWQFPGATVITAHLSGQSLWITFPRSDHNREIMETSARLAFGIQEIEIYAILEEVEEVKIQILDAPKAFVVDALQYQAWICLNTSVHVWGPLWLPHDARKIGNQLNLLLDRWRDALRLDIQLSLDIKGELKQYVAGLQASMGELNSESNDIAMIERLRERVEGLGDASQS
jgi:hypothetical protein